MGRARAITLNAANGRKQRLCPAELLSGLQLARLHCGFTIDEQNRSSHYHAFMTMLRPNPPASGYLSPK